jgi:pyruvate formate lyase activating enzyme
MGIIVKGVKIMISRRKFLVAAAKTGSLVGVPLIISCKAFGSNPGNAGYLSVGQIKDLIRTAPKARYWISTASAGANCQQCHKPAEIPKGKGHEGQEAIVKCLLCARSCIIHPDERGECRARINIKGELHSLVYGRPISIHVDPIEKKPLYHFLPGSSAFSLATAGCPLRCKFCQNWEISQASPEDFDTDFIAPQKIVSAASSRQSPVIAFTYNEPTVFTEYLLDIASLARQQEMRSVLISCGFMNTQPLTDMCRILDAIKIDLKGYSPDFYRNVCDAELGPVLNSIRQIAGSGIHLEIVNLVVPTLNDSEKMMRGLVEWILGEIGPDVPIHFTRFHPDYRLINLPPTPVAILERFRDHAMDKGIHYAYIGNVPNHPGNHTYCPKCGKAIIKRTSFFVLEMNVENGKCKFCGARIAGVWS